VVSAPTCGRLLAGVASLCALTLLVGCPGPPCDGDRDCETGFYCAIDESSGEGRCSQDCNDFFGCPEESFCNNRGQCQLEPEPPQLSLTEPAGTVQGEPGDPIPVAGEVRFRGEVLSLSVQTEDWRGCDPDPGLHVDIDGDPERVLTVPFSFPALALPAGGGELIVEARQGVFKVQERRQLVAGDPCEGCPQIRITAPQSGALADRLFFSRLTGEVEGAFTGAAYWSVGNGDLATLQAPLTVDINGRFEDVMTPLELGRNWISVRVSNDAGSSVCHRYLDTSALSGDRLEVTLGWSSADADLDLFVIPPGGRYGPGACSAALSDEARADACLIFGDAFGYGPETVVIPTSGATGSYGILVVGFSATAGEIVETYLRIFSHGRQLAALGPRELEPGRAQIWVAGVATVAADRAGAGFVTLDEIIDYAPTRTPEAWPPY